MLTPKDLEKYHQAAERILNAMDNSPVPISWHEMDRMALQSVIARHELREQYVWYTTDSS